VPAPLRRALAPLTLAYHGVNHIAPADNAMELVMAPGHLASQVRFLQRLGYAFATAEEVAATGRPQARGTAVLTFDDGWRDALTVVAPLLGGLGVRATFYVNPGVWGASHQLVTGDAGRLMSADDARALVHEAGMELGAHSMRHDDLRTLDDAALAADLADGKAAVEEVSGRPCRTLAYPFGAYDERVQRATAAAGYDLAWAWLPGPWAPLAAPRLPGPTRAGAVRLAAKLATGGVRRTQAVGPAPPQP
jgi:peptidoglycan/xylan/chitin deacetylase (PgdA/CDA1 family)